MSHTEVKRYTCTKEGMKEHPQGNMVPFQRFVEEALARLKAETEVNRLKHRYGEEL